ncbi:MAG: hypothetical protein JRF63_00055 [Deltaproteobacteria bacterium]|nr:hypothetical protein [Deltaproteobacteria bacterium]
MRRVAAVMLVAALFGLGCDLGVQQRSATRTLTGVTSSQVANAAQAVFVDKGFDLAAVSSSSGFVKTVWLESSRKQLMFTVSTDQVADEEGNDLRGIKTVTVQGFARDRLVGGWSEEYQTDYRIEEVLDAVADRLTDPSTKPAPSRKAATKAECKATDECQSGKHCAGKKCVHECKDDAGCAEGELCDDRGRCVAPLPEPEPCPVSPEPEPDAVDAGSEEVTP